MWTWLDSDTTEIGLKVHINCRCACGKVQPVWVPSILEGALSCRSCAMRLRMASKTDEERRALAKKASLKATEVIQNKKDPYGEKYGCKQLNTVLNTLASAKQRCTNPNSNQYCDYGLRGIKFQFPSLRAAAEWVLDNIGPKPDGLSLDRIDNNRHYEPGNLRWATRSEQARNKRPYKRTANGERIRRILEQRSDLTYETVRVWIKQGRTDDEILNTRKYNRSFLIEKTLC